MIDDARALHHATVAQIDHHEAEIARLRLLADALEAFIDQPPAGSNGQSGASVSAPVSGPDDPPAVQQPGSARSTRKRASDGPVGTPTPASNNGAAARHAKLIAAGPYPCPTCEREFSRPQGLGRHRPNCTGPLLTPEPVVDDHPKHPSRSEKFLCGRNCGASFLSRQGVKDHEAEAKCSPIPTRPPVGHTPLGSLSSGTRSGGFGQ